VDVAVIGAGVAGLTCAGELARAGRTVVVLDKGRGVGGRCATRRVVGQPVDHGVPYLHGSDPRFVAAVRAALGDDLVEGWPVRVAGEGKPCLRRAFFPGEWRAACRVGLSAFPKALASGLDVRTGFTVVAVRCTATGFEIEDASGAVVAARQVVVALPAPQTRELAADALADGVEGELLDMVSLSRCLTVIADYGAREAPEVDLWIPSDTGAVHQIVHDSAKRSAPARTILVVQGLPGWSARCWDEPPEAWSRVLLDEAAAHVGSWVAAPVAIDVQRWRYARTDGVSEFRGPVLRRFGETRMMGFAGEAFSPGGGVQGAWESGLALARRLLSEGA